MKNNLRMVMAEQRVNIADLHRATNLSRSTIVYLYNEEKQCNIHSLMQICDALNITPNDILITKKA